MLLLRAAKLFAHVRDVLRLAPGASAINFDYSAVLRTHLLAEPAYCAAAPTSTFQGARPALAAGCHLRLLLHLKWHAELQP